MRFLFNILSLTTIIFFNQFSLYAMNNNSIDKNKKKDKFNWKFSNNNQSYSRVVFSDTAFNVGNAFNRTINFDINNSNEVIPTIQINNESVEKYEQNLSLHEKIKIIADTQTSLQKEYFDRLKNSAIQERDKFKKITEEILNEERKESSLQASTLQQWEEEDIPKFSQYLMNLAKNDQETNSFSKIRNFLLNTEDLNTPIKIKKLNNNNNDNNNEAISGSTPLKIFIDLLCEKKIQCTRISEILELFISKGAYFNTQCFKKLLGNKEIYESPLESIIVGLTNNKFSSENQVSLKCLLYYYKKDLNINEIINTSKFTFDDCVLIRGYFDELCDELELIHNKVIYSMMKWQEDTLAHVSTRKKLFMGLDEQFRYIPNFLDYINKKNVSNNVVKILQMLLDYGARPYYYCGIYNYFPYEALIPHNQQPSSEQIKMSNMLLDGIVNYFEKQLLNSKILTWLLCMKHAKWQKMPVLLKKMIVNMINEGFEGLENLKNAIKDAKENEWYKCSYKKNTLRNLISKTLSKWDVKNPENGSYCEIK